ncbi:MAG: VCBS repeat-containing protein [Phycisphaerae bacterium]|nr:VCBS repeat-containing protein [Phycisphaerae bacterium]
MNQGPAMKRVSIRGLIRGSVAVLAAGLCMGQSCSDSTPVSPPVGSACGQFAAECVNLLGTAPYALAPADLDKDSDIDLVVVNFGTANVSVLLNPGDGRLVESGRYTVTDWPDDVAIGDWNADGHLDLAVQGPLGVSLLAGSGDGTFASAVTLDIWQNAPQRLTAADMDGDHRLDLVIAGGVLVADNVTIMRNNGRAHFTAAQSVTVDELLAGFSAAEVADLNGDSSLDLVLANRYAGKVHILTADGQGGYSTSALDVAGASHILNDLLIQDMDGDGTLDFVVADNGNPLDAQDAGSVILLLNPISGTTSPVNFSAGTSPVSLATGDVNGDGLRDIIVANNMSDDVSVLFGQRAGGFASRMSIAVGDGPTAVVARDFSNDGNLDIAVSNMNSGTVSILINDGTGHFTATR